MTVLDNCLLQTMLMKFNAFTIATHLKMSSAAYVWWRLTGYVFLNPWVKVFRIILELRILRLESQPQNAK